MQFTFTEGHGDASIFGPDSLSGQIGKEIPINIEGEHDGTLKILNAEVTADGVSITVELPDDSKLARMLRENVFGEGWSLGDG
jgi:hypothetical protein